MTGPPAAARLLPHRASAPDWNMAVDEAILRLGETPTLRLYGWEPPGISLGRFQPGRGGLAELLRSGLPVVRRMTGGGAIVHWHELTYSVVLPLDHPALLGTDTRESYEVLHRPIRTALEDLGVRTAGRGAGAHGRDGPVLCFDRATPLDLVVGGRKLVGSAQRRVAGRLLQHGSLVLRTNPLQPGTAALEAVLGRPVAAGEVADALTRAFADLLPGLAPGALSPDEEAFARKAAPGYRFC